MFDLFKTVFKYREKQSPDKLGLYPEAIHTNAFPERRYLWSSRILVIFAALSICLNLALSSGIYLMIPQRRAAPYLFRHEYTFNRLEPIARQERPIAAIDLLNEMFIEDYILRRHTVTADYDEVLTRWKPGSKLYWMSSQTVYQSFASTDVAQSINAFRRQGLVRLAEVEWIQPLSRGFWLAQFVTMDYYPREKTPIINIWRAYVRTTMAAISYDNKELRANNPFGFLVLNYSLSYVGTPDNPVEYIKEAKELRFEESAN
jgi:type IV secretory pathway component VirB8